MPKTKDDSLKYAHIVEEATLKARLKEIRKERYDEFDRRATIVFNYIFGVIGFAFVWIGSMFLFAQAYLMWKASLEIPAISGFVGMMFISAVLVQAISWFILFRSIQQLNKLEKKGRTC